MLCVHGGVQVPKMLNVLRHEWVPDAFVVSFKLETDENILLTKVRQMVGLRTAANPSMRSCPNHNDLLLLAEPQNVPTATGVMAPMQLRYVMQVLWHV